MMMKNRSLNLIKKNNFSIKKTSFKGNQELQESRKSLKNNSTKNRSKRIKARIIIVEVDLAIC